MRAESGVAASRPVYNKGWSIDESVASNTLLSGGNNASIFKRIQGLETAASGRPTGNAPLRMTIDGESDVERTITGARLDGNEVSVDLRRILDPDIPYTKDAAFKCLAQEACRELLGDKAGDVLADDTQSGNDLVGYIVAASLLGKAPNVDASKHKALCDKLKGLAEAYGEASRKEREAKERLLFNNDKAASKSLEKALKKATREKEKIFSSDYNVGSPASVTGKKLEDAITSLMHGKGVFGTVADVLYEKYLANGLPKALTEFERERRGDPDFTPNGDALLESSLAGNAPIYENIALSAQLESHTRSDDFKGLMNFINSMLGQLNLKSPERVPEPNAPSIEPAGKSAPDEWPKAFVERGSNYQKQGDVNVNFGDGFFKPLFGELFKSLPELLLAIQNLGGASAPSQGSGKAPLPVQKVDAAVNTDPAIPEDDDILRDLARLGGIYTESAGEIDEDDLRRRLAELVSTEPAERNGGTAPLPPAATNINGQSVAANPDAMVSDGDIENLIQPLWDKWTERDMPPSSKAVSWREGVSELGEFRISRPQFDKYKNIYVPQSGQADGSAAPALADNGPRPTELETGSAPKNSNVPKIVVIPASSPSDDFSGNVEVAPPSSTGSLETSPAVPALADDESQPAGAGVKPKKKVSWGPDVKPDDGGEVGRSTTEVPRQGRRTQPVGADVDTKPKRKLTLDLSAKPNEHSASSTAGVPQPVVETKPPKTLTFELKPELMPSNSFTALGFNGSKNEGYFYQIASGIQGFSAHEKELKEYIRDGKNPAEAKADSEDETEKKIHGIYAALKKQSNSKPFTDHLERLFTQYYKRNLSSHYGFIKGAVESRVVLSRGSSTALSSFPSRADVG